MSDDADGAHELVDAATVHAARRDVVQAVAALAASPLDEAAADRMRAALARATSPTVQRAAGRIGSARGRSTAKKAALFGLPNEAGLPDEAPTAAAFGSRPASYQPRPTAGLGDAG